MIYSWLAWFFGEPMMPFMGLATILFALFAAAAYAARNGGED